MQFVITVLTFSGIAFASSSSEEEEEEEDAVQEAMDAKRDQTKEMAEEAIVNGTCLPGLEIMKILAHPDRDVAILGTEIPTCGPGF